MPWGWVDERVVTVPSSLEEGVLIRGPDGTTNRKRVEFVLLHEFGHLANKEYFHPNSPWPYSPVRRFEELFASYWANSFVSSHDPAWAEAAETSWEGVVSSFTPPVLSLDWGWNVVDGLPPAVWARTYAWYQNFLNLRAAALPEAHGIDLLATLKERLPWDEAGTWDSASLLPALEWIAPGFREWARDLEQGEYLPESRAAARASGAAR